jgi:hypothetical protein
MDTHNDIIGLWPSVDAFVDALNKHRDPTRTSRINREAKKWAVWGWKRTNSIPAHFWMRVALAAIDIGCPEVTVELLCMTQPDDDEEKTGGSPSNRVSSGIMPNDLRMSPPNDSDAPQPIDRLCLA